MAADKSKKERRKAPSDIIVIDVGGSTLGRAASLIAKRILNGEKIDAVNADKALISIHSAEDYQEMSKRGSREWGPFAPKSPELWFRHTVRGMVPHTITRGRLALQRFRAYEGVPAKYEGVAAEKLAGAQRPATSVHEYVTLREFAVKKLGAHER